MSEQKSAKWVTEYSVQPFVWDRRKLRPEPPRPARDEAGALRLGQRLAQGNAGVVVLSRRCAPELGDYEEAVVLARYGQVPEGLEAA